MVHLSRQNNIFRLVAGNSFYRFGRSIELLFELQRRHIWKSLCFSAGFLFSIRFQHFSHIRTGWPDLITKRNIKRAYGIRQNLVWRDWFTTGLFEKSESTLHRRKSIRFWEDRSRTTRLNPLSFYDSGWTTLHSVYSECQPELRYLAERRTDLWR